MQIKQFIAITTTTTSTTTTTTTTFGTNSNFENSKNHLRIRLVKATEILNSDVSKPLSRKSHEIVAAQESHERKVLYAASKRISGFLANRGKVETVIALPVHYISFLKTVIHTLREATFRLPTLF